ncbi:MAG: glucose 1-dehydrogenase [Lachnospiraceae bacterium]|nr:glucose 1-dehydrogenase [Lachnospiraceae bacterium]
MGSLEGKVAIVTGAARGNGEAIARVIAREGGIVILTDILDLVFETAKDIGGTAEAYKMDVTSREDIHRVVTEVAEKHGHIDIMVNNAGISKPVPFLECSDESRDAHLKVMLLSSWVCCQEVLPYMVKQHYGRIVSISSVTGPITGEPGSSAYAMCKAGLIGLTKNLALEFAQDGITVNAIMPGYIRTSMVESVIEESNPGHGEEAIAAMGREIPVQRLGRPVEIGELVAFLASDKVGYLTGEAIVIDGGNQLVENHFMGTK